MAASDDRRLTIYQGITVYLKWSAAFVHRFFRSLEPHVRQVVLAHLVENADRFPMDAVERLRDRAFVGPGEAGLAASRLQRTYCADVLHTHLGYSATKLMLLKHFLQVPMVATFGGQDLCVRACWPDGGRLFRYVFRNAEQFVAVSDDLRRRAIELGCPAEKIVTIHRGVDADEFHYVDRSGRAGRPVEILMIGRLVEKKGHRYAVAALAALPKGAPPWRLTIIGDGPSKGAVRRRLRRAGLLARARMLDVMPPAQVRREMAAADIMLHPAVTTPDGDREGIPNVLMEAQATGLAVIATRHGGIPELVLDGETGLLTPERDTAALAAAIGRLLADAESRLRLGRAGAERIGRCFSIERQARAYLDIYRRLAERYPRGCAELRRVPDGPPLTVLMRAARAESSARGYLPVVEVVEGFTTGRGAGSPSFRHRAVRGLRRRLPLGLKQRGKALMFGLGQRMFRRMLERNAAGDDRDWEALRGDGFPDPLAPAEDAP